MGSPPQNQSAFRILIIGGSGSTGRLVIDKALLRGHRVTALVRNTKSVPLHQGLTFVEGSPLNRADIERAVTAVPEDKPNVIVSTLGQQRKSRNPWASPITPKLLMANSVANAIEVAKQHNIPKIVIMSMFGTGSSFSNLNFMMRLTMKSSNMLQTLEDHNAVDEEVKKSGINFVMARPAMLKGNVASPIIFYGDEGAGSGTMPSISPQSVAVFLLDAAESSIWDGTTPTITNGRLV